MNTSLKWSSLKFISVIIMIINIIWTIQLHNKKQKSIDSCNRNKDSSYIRVASPPISRPLHLVIDHSEKSIIEEIKKSNKTNSYSLAFSDVDLSYGRWDNMLLYKMKDFALIGDTYGEASSESSVCLATQASVERLSSLAQVAEMWKGPISVALFIAGHEEFVILQYFVTYIRLCSKNIRNNITFHIGVPREYEKLPKLSDTLVIENKHFECQYPEKTLRSLLKFRSLKTLQWRLKNIYPQNHMRNLARKGCQSKYVFLTDIDIIPSENSVQHLNTFLQTASCNGRCAYVIPTFEIDVRARFPSSKESLVRLLKKGLARPFHEKVFIYNQYATNFSRWISQNSHGDFVSISHNVTNFEFLYEPFFISLDNVPAHDERFMGYGFTRNTQVYEMYVAGYKFFVLSPVFTCHWGLQRKQARPAWREQQNNNNRKKFETFKSEVFGRYRNDPLLMINYKKKNK